MLTESYVFIQVNVVDNPNVRTFVVLGDPQLKYATPSAPSGSRSQALLSCGCGYAHPLNSCGGATGPVTVQLGGQQTVSQSTTLNANIGVDIEGISIGGGASTTDETSTTVTKSITYTIPPGRQAVYVAGTNQLSETGNVQVNYGDRQYGHFIVCRVLLALLFAVHGSLLTARRD